MTYDIVQTTFLLGMASNGAAGIKATQTELQGYLETYLNGGTDQIGTQFDGFFPLMNSQLAGGDWTVVWGPCLYSRNGDQPGEATNAMYVAHSPALSTYVVAVAATNFKSIYDWVAEDFDVLPNYMAEWPLAVPFEMESHLPWIFDIPPGISAATALGVSDLLTKLIDNSKGSIDEFLTATANSNDTLIFCGHSLAGALSPTLALYLYPQFMQGSWNQVLVLPTAGATPGNQEFADTFDLEFPPIASGVNAAYGNWNTDYANANDAVPHAWNQLSDIISLADSAGNYPSFYGVMVPRMGRYLYDLLEGIDVAVALGFYMNISQSIYQPDWGLWAWTQNADGSWQYPPVWKPAPVYTDTNPISTLAALLGMVQATHIDQYYNFLNVVPAPRMSTSMPTNDRT